MEDLFNSTKDIIDVIEELDHNLALKLNLQLSYQIDVYDDKQEVILPFYFYSKLQIVR